MRLKRISNEVSIADEPIVKLAQSDLEELKRSLAASTLGRSRICAHKESTDALHEMLIALAQKTYIRPHKHFGKSESFHVIEGAVDVVLFSDAGAISDVIPLGELSSGRLFYYRLSDPIYHTLLIRTELVVLHEITNGPFKREDTAFAPWAPEDKDLAGVQNFSGRLAELVRRYEGGNLSLPGSL
jgi:cupin fold WbuC family metalloprotein